MTKSEVRRGLWVMAALLCGAVSAGAEPRRGEVAVELTFNVTPADAWQPGQNVVLSADVRRNPAMGQEDVFRRESYGLRFRGENQRFTFTIPEARVGEKVLVQGYMCSELGSDCYPSDGDNPPSCAAEVHVRGNLTPSCAPVFTWTGGSGDGGVLCRAECR